MKFVNQLDYPHLMYKRIQMTPEFFEKNKALFENLKGMQGAAAQEKPAPGTPLPPGNVEKGGCGLCCAVMAADQLTPNSQFSLEDALDISYEAKANFGGTDYDLFGPAFAEKMGYAFASTNSLADVDEVLKTGGVAVASVAGDRVDGHVGVFTHGWHYILVFAKREDGKYAILDPSQTPTKYDEPGRKELVEAGKLIVDGNILYVDGDILAEEVKLLNPGFFLFCRK